MKIIQGFHYHGINHHLYLEVDRPFHWVINKNTVGKKNADVPLTLDHVQCKLHYGDKASVLVTRVWSGDEAKVKYQSLKAEFGRVKPVLNGANQPSKKYIVWRLGYAYADMLWAINAKLIDRPNTIKCDSINKKYRNYDYIYNKNGNHVSKHIKILKNKRADTLDANTSSLLEMLTKDSKARNTIAKK